MNTEEWLKNEQTPAAPEDMIYQLLSVVGDGTGAVDMNAAAAEYTIRPAINEKYRLKRMNILQVDGNWNSATAYGASSALTLGIKITVKDSDDAVVKDFTPVTIKTSYEWAMLAGSDVPSIGGAGADPMTIRWTFGKGGGDIILDGSKGEYFSVEMQDSMAFLNFCRMQVQGSRRVV